ncbi:MAG: hypothetical protein M3R01_06260, partial [Actinomycetota bacterium]|nr:hypothetical protein [Actinomycetota bacterium]
MTARVALATASAVGDLDEDMAPLLAALGDRGVEGHVVVWDDPAVGWGSFDLVVVRSTWDYAWRRDEFLAWAEGVAAVVTLSNPAPVLRWNTDKHYLRDLEAAGVAVVPTCFVEPGAEAALPPTGEYVVKPVVSAGAKDTVRYGEGPAEVERARALLGRLADSGRSAMVQPYLHAVDEAGETALIFLGGAYSHAIRKGPILAPGAGPVSGLYAEEHIEARTPSGAERSSA